ncbi:hypothetical protein N9K55_01250 [Candidatus Pelagibacter bacterium]|jgi:hypothetical protein|nr:hypothetical protein [Candidatus Pelagibacter bacterium]
MIKIIFLTLSITILFFISYLAFSAIKKGVAAKKKIENENNNLD